MILFFSLWIGIYSSAYGQSSQRVTHVGLEASFGLHGFSMSDCDTKYMKPRALTRGGSIGFVAGNKLLRARIRAAGFYQSTGFTRIGFNLIESEALVNFYPLEFFRTRKNVLDIYVTTGVKLNNFKLNDKNTYRDIDLHPNFNDSNTHPGKEKVLTQVAGLGIEFLLPNKVKSVHLFAEAIISNPIYSSATISEFYEAWSQGETCFNIGVRFGSKHTGKADCKTQSF